MTRCSNANSLFLHGFFWEWQKGYDLVGLRTMGCLQRKEREQLNCRFTLDCCFLLMFAAIFTQVVELAWEIILGSLKIKNGLQVKENNC
jgi:hypothetical protein